MELDEMAEQLELEVCGIFAPWRKTLANDSQRRLVGGASFWDLQREMWTIKGNRNRALISIGLMVCQQMTGTYGIP
jgi:hypothetical protein